jgi:hypothetical protein
LKEKTMTILRINRDLFKSDEIINWDENARRLKEIDLSTIVLEKRRPSAGDARDPKRLQREKDEGVVLYGARTSEGVCLDADMMATIVAAPANFPEEWKRTEEGCAIGVVISATTLVDSYDTYVFVLFWKDGAPQTGKFYYDD